MEQRNLILAIALSIVILLGFNFLTPKRPAPPPAETQAQQVADGTKPAAPGDASAPSAAAPTQAAFQDRAALLTESRQRVAIETPRVKGSINLKGARFDDLTLLDYRETTDPKSPAIVLLSPSGAVDAHIVEQGWVAGKGTSAKLPGADTVWQASAGSLTAKTPVTLTWDNGEGLKFTRTISIDDNFMFQVKDSVANTGTAPVTLLPYALVSRTGMPAASGTWISYEGPIGGFDGVETEVSYSNLIKEKTATHDSTGGWLGFDDKYWLTAVIPDQTKKIQARFTQAGEGPSQKFQADYLGAETEIAPGATIENAGMFFAGAKEAKLLDTYTDTLKIAGFDKAVDWGWFRFLTKPIFYLLDWVYGMVGNFGIAILVLTVIIKGLFFPLANKAYVSMDKMRQLQPEMQKLKEKYGEDKGKLQQETMALYKRVGANPVAGCLPILLQIPVFFSLYKVLYVSIEMRHAPFYGWIHDLSAPDPTSLFNLFGLIPFTPPHFLMIGAWPAIYCATMYLQQKMSPQPPDPAQARMMQMMPFIFTFMMGGFPAGLVIYWSWNNTLTIAQQWLIRSRAARAQAK